MSNETPEDPNLELVKQFEEIFVDSRFVHEQIHRAMARAVVTMTNPELTEGAKAAKIIAAGDEFTQAIVDHYRK